MDSQKTIPFTAEKIGPIKPWVAEIKGKDEAYGFARVFLQPCVDYANKNSCGSRGIEFTWDLENGKVYELCYRESWKTERRRFVKIVDNQLVDIKKNAVLNML